MSWPRIQTRRLSSLLLLLLALWPAGAAASGPKVRRLDASPEAFTLRELRLSCELASLKSVNRRGGAAPDSVIPVNYRFRIMDGSAEVLWDSGWLQAPSPSSRGRVRTPVLAVRWRPEPARAATLAEIRIEATAESGGRTSRPRTRTFYRWADGRYRDWLEEAWGDTPPGGLSWVPQTIGGAGPPGLAPFQENVISQPVEHPPTSPANAPPALRSSWGALKARHRAARA
jgi:hypothetical protein